MKLKIRIGREKQHSTYQFELQDENFVLVILIQICYVYEQLLRFYIQIQTSVLWPTKWIWETILSIFLDTFFWLHKIS